MVASKADHWVAWKVSKTAGSWAERKVAWMAVDLVVQTAACSAELMVVLLVVLMVVSKAGH